MEIPLLDRIEMKPDVLKGKAIIKGTRLSVQYILSLLGSGADIDEILSEYKGLQKEDILACLIFAAKTLDDYLFLPTSKDVA